VTSRTRNLVLAATLTVAAALPFLLKARRPADLATSLGLVARTLAPASDESTAMSRVAEATDATKRVAQRPGTRDVVAVPSMIIRTGDASVLVDSLEAAVTRVTQLAQRLGGFVANTSMQAGPSQVRSATLTLKIPAPRYEEALGGLEPLGEVETTNTNAEDVGEEFVDVQARVANARRLEERLVALLTTRTGKLEDVLAVERELARVREVIERYDGRLRFLRSRVAMSTLTVTVHEAAPLIGHNPSASILGDAVKSAWRNFVGFAAGLIASLGFIIPLGAIAGVVVVGGRRLMARLEPKPATPTASSNAGAAA